MVQINFAQKQVNAKVVYYGPGMSGKTTNLEVVHQRAPEQNKGDLTSISTDGDRTLFFDFMPLDLGTVAGMRTCFQIYTVPGQVYYNSTRKLVLQGVDGVVFVADSSAAMKEENFESLRNLEENLNEYGKSLATMPHVIQFNKRDLPDALPVDELNALFNTHNAPFFEAIAKSGQGVFPTLKALAARVLESIHQSSGGNRQSSAAPAGARAPAAALPRPVQEQAMAPQSRMHAPAGAQSAAPAQAGQYDVFGNPVQGQGQAPMMAPPPMGSQGAALPNPHHAPPQPAMNQAGILTQTGFHNSTLAGAAQRQQAQPQQQAGAGNPSLHMTQRPIAPGATANSARTGAPPPRPKAPARPQSAGAGKALEGTRFRPRNQAGARSEPRATPTAGGKGKQATWLMVAAGAVISGLLVWVATTFF
jgi:signal recognition particle receptor subunit beta